MASTITFSIPTTVFNSLKTLHFEANITSICKISNTKYALALSIPGNIHIVSYPSSDIIQTLKGHRTWIKILYLHSKTGHLISISYNYYWRIWNHLSGVCLGVLREHSRWINGIAEMNNGNIITVSNDKSIKLWDMSLYQCYRTISRAHEGQINDIVILRDNLFITCGCDGRLIVWEEDAETKDDFVTVITCTLGTMNSMMLSKSGAWLVLTSTAIWCYDRDEFTLIKVWEWGTEVSNLFLLLNNGDVAVATKKNEIRIFRWNEEVDVNGRILLEHSNTISGVFELESNVIVSGSWDQTVKVIVDDECE